GAVQELRRGRQRERLDERADHPGAEKREREGQVEMDVRPHRGHEGGFSRVRIRKVQHDEAYVAPSRVLEERPEQERIGLEKIDVGIAEAGVELERPAGVAARLERD